MAATLAHLPSVAGAVPPVTAVTAAKKARRPSAAQAEAPALILPPAPRSRRKLVALEDAAEESPAESPAQPRGEAPAAATRLDEEEGADDSIEDEMLAAEKEISARGRQWKNQVDLLLMGHEQPGSESLPDEVFERLRSKLDLKPSWRPMTAYLYSLGLRRARSLFGVAEPTGRLLTASAG